MAQPGPSQLKRCEKCSANTRAIISLQDSRSNQTVTMQNNFAALQISAQLGCDICRLLMQGLIYSTSTTAEYESLQHSNQSIVLWYSRANTFNKGIFPPSSTDNFVVSCSVYPKWYMNLIPFFSGPESGDNKLSMLNNVGKTLGPIHDPPTEYGQKSMQSALILAAKWISICRESHCCGGRGEGLKADSPDFPTRVVDLRYSEGPRLLIKRDASVNIRSEPYTALSHCWGAAAGHLVTTTSNLKQMVSEIPIAEMPKTYLDAFEVTRRLGLRFIWIDAICIVQDDKEDWQVESAKMCDIYSNAYCTIAASSAASNGEGCFVGQNTPRQSVDSCRLTTDDNECHSEIILRPPRPSWKNQILSAPLNTRAWVLQERLLSPKILHFAKDAIFWECNELKASIFEENGIPDVELLADPIFYKYSLRNLTIAEGTESAWLELVQHYTSLGITKEQDRLPALSGLAKMIQRKTNDAYVAGIWKSDLVRGLAWALSGKDFKPHELHKKRPYTAPSWSWASTDRALGFLTVVEASRFSRSTELPTGGEWEPDVKILNVNIETGIDPTGQVLGGRIVVSGYIDVLPVSMEQRDPGYLQLRLRPGVEAKGSANLIHLDYPKSPSIASFLALRLCHRPTQKEDKHLTCLLILEATGNTPDQYRRIGRATLYGLSPVNELDSRVIELV